MGLTVVEVDDMINILDHDVVQLGSDEMLVLTIALADMDDGCCKHFFKGPLRTIPVGNSLSNIFDQTPSKAPLAPILANRYSYPVDRSPFATDRTSRASRRDACVLAGWSCT
jgi:hypothetical protein